MVPEGCSQHRCSLVEKSLFNRGVDLCNVGGQRNVSLFRHCPPALSRRYRNYGSDIGSLCWLYGVFCVLCVFVPH